MQTSGKTSGTRLSEYRSHGGVSRERALEELRKENEDLYQAPIQVDNQLLPFVFSGIRLRDLLVPSILVLMVIILMCRKNGFDFVSVIVLCMKAF